MAAALALGVAVVAAGAEWGRVRGGGTAGPTTTTAAVAFLLGPVVPLIEEVLAGGRRLLAAACRVAPNRSPGGGRRRLGAGSAGGWRRRAARRLARSRVGETRTAPAPGTAPYRECGTPTDRRERVLGVAGRPLATENATVCADCRTGTATVTDADADADADGAVVLDGTLDQFSRANHDEGRVHVALGPREDLPTVACLVVGRDDRYDRWYTGGRPERADGGGPHP